MRPHAPPSPAARMLALLPLAAARMLALLPLAAARMLALLPLAGWLCVGCAPDAGEPAAERAREEIREALARGDREQALFAIGELEHALPESTDAVYERAQWLVRAGEAARAVWLLEDATFRHPDDVALRLLLAESALLVNDPARARRALATLPPADPEQATQALLLRARAALALGDLDAALDLFRRAEARDPQRTELRGPRIAALLAEGRLDEAEQAVDAARRSAQTEEERALARSFELALQQLRADGARSRLQAALLTGDAAAAETARTDLAAAVDAMGALARAASFDLAAWQAWVFGLVGSGRPEEARQAVEAALTDAPERLALHALHAHVLQALGEEDAAEAALREGMRRDPSPGGCLPLVHFLAARGREDEALAILEAARVRAGDETHAPLLYARTELLLDAERTQAALGAIERLAESRADDDPSVELLRARLVLLRGDAAAAAERLRALAPRLDTAATQYWLGRALEASGDTRGAERRYALASLRAPSEPGPYAAIARLARRRGAWREAAAAGQQLVLRAPTAIDGWETWVEALLQLGYPDLAHQVALRCEALLPDTPEPALLRARALRGAGRRDEALALLEDLRARFGETPEIVSEWVLAAGETRDEALAAAERALEAPGTTPQQRAALHHARAVALFAADRFDEGARAVDAALDADGEDLRPLRTRCEFAAARGRLASARRDCARYLALRPDDAGVHFVHGVVLDQSGNTDAAMRAYERAARLDPGAAAPRNNLAHLRLAAGDLEGALEAAQQAYAAAPDDPQVLDTLAELYLARGLPERALALLERAAALAPDDATIAAHLRDARDSSGPEPGASLR